MTTLSISSSLQRNKELVNNFNEKEINYISDFMHEQEIKKGEIFIRKGEPADQLAFIVSGIVQIIDNDQQIAIEKVGDTVGESMFADMQATSAPTRIADVQALDDTTVAWLTDDNFERLLKRNPSLGIKLREHFRAIKAIHDEENFATNFKERRQYLALIAHNNMKNSLVEFCKFNADKIDRFPLIATGTTGSLLFKETGLVLSRKVASGPLGGDQAVGMLISTNNICGVIFFRDPLSAHPHQADIAALGRLCDVYQIPFATNPRSGVAILDYLLSDHADEHFIPNRVLDMYKNNQQQVVENR